MCTCISPQEHMSRHRSVQLQCHQNLYKWRTSTTCDQNCANQPFSINHVNWVISTARMRNPWPIKWCYIVVRQLVALLLQKHCSEIDTLLLSNGLLNMNLWRQSNFIMWLYLHHVRSMATPVDETTCMEEQEHTRSLLLNQKIHEG